MKITKTLLLNDRSLFQIHGPDSFDFLQSVITADTSPLKEGKAVASCLLSAQGRILFDFLIYPDRYEKSFSCKVDCFHKEKDELIKKLTLYKMRSRVEINDIDDQVIAISSTNKEKAFRDPRHKKLPFRTIISKDKMGESSSYDENYKQNRLKLCVAEGPEEIPRGEALPLDFWMDKTTQVSFNKGCFIGQEVTARVYHRNKIRRRLIVVETRKFNASDGALPGKGFKYILQNKDMVLLLAPLEFLEISQFRNKMQLEWLGKKYNYYLYL
jgi:hypothetical protein